MKATKATLTYEQDGEEITVTYPDMQVKDIAHAMIELAQPKLEIVVSESQIERFRQEAKKLYNDHPGLFISYSAYDPLIDLIVQLKTEAHIRLERSNQSYNEAVMAYSKMVEELTEQLNEK